VSYIGGFDKADNLDRYVLVNELGNGRVLSRSPSISQDGNGGYLVRCPVQPAAQRITAAEMPTDILLNFYGPLHWSKVVLVSSQADSSFPCQ
jgi:hypothetical protein